MNAFTEGKWMAQQPSQFINKITTYPRNHYGAVIQHHRAWRGLAVRKGADGKPEFERCYHAHQKKSAARECGEKLARRLNKQPVTS